MGWRRRTGGVARVEGRVEAVGARLRERPEREIRSRELGGLIMDELKALDDVAYVRFASVYRDFKDLPDFVKALEGLMHKEAQKEASPGPGSGPGLGPESGQGRVVPAKPQPQALFPAEAETPVLRTRKK